MFVFVFAQLRKVLPISPSLVVMLLLMQITHIIWKWGTAMALQRVRFVLALGFRICELLINSVNFDFA